MARRFFRDNFLFPQNLRQARFDPKARRVDSFEEASQGNLNQAPTRPFEIQRPNSNNKLLQLSESLGLAGRTANQVGTRIKEDFDQRAEAEGARLANEQALEGNKGNWRQMISRTRQSSGNEAARELLEMNPHVQRGFDQTYSRNAALRYNAEVQSEFSKNPLLDEETGLRLHDVEITSPEYQAWLQGFQEQFNQVNGLDTIDPRVLGNVIPAQQDANTRVSQAQDELRSSRRLQDYENASSEFFNTVVYDLHSNEAWQTGEDNLAVLSAAELITQQIDEANSLGFGGDDLNTVYANAIATIASIATATDNPRLLEVAEFVEVGRPDQRQLLLQTKEGTKFRDILERARQSIVDREWQTYQRDNAREDREREESSRGVFNSIAEAAALYEQSGRTPQAREMLEAAINSGREEALVFGYAPDFDSRTNAIQQNAFDNQGVTIVDFRSIGDLETRIVSGQISGEAATREIINLYSQGAFGTEQQAADTILRLQSRVKEGDDQGLRQFGSSVDQAASQISSVIEQRMGYTRDQNNRLTSLKEVLNGSGFSDGQIQNLTTMNSQQVQDYINQREAANNPLSAQAQQAMFLVVNEGINPLEATTDAYDSGDVVEQVNQFKSDVYREYQRFEEENGRRMTPQEQEEFITQRQDAFLNGQTSSLAPSNPLSSTRTARNDRDRAAEEIASVFFEDLDEELGDPRSSQVLSMEQLIQAQTFFYNNDRRHHPDIVAIAQRNNMTPQDFMIQQFKQNDVEPTASAYADLGVPMRAESFGTPYSALGSKNISEDYVRGDYQVDTPFFYDESPPGSYDFTISQNGNYNANIPSPFEGTVVMTGSDNRTGNYIVVKQAGTGTEMLIGHMNSVYLNEGDRIQLGQALGQQGTTGSSTGEHLHIQFYDNNGTPLRDRSQTEPIVRNWITYIESGVFIGSGDSDNFSGGGELGEAITDAANDLQVPADELAALLFLESGLDPSAVGGDGNNYQGLWQLNPENRSLYGVDASSSPTEQLNALKLYARDRGFEPGRHDIRNLYASILAGRAWLTESMDSNGTTASNAVASFRAGGFRNNEARRILGW